MSSTVMENNVLKHTRARTDNTRHNTSDFAFNECIHINYKPDFPRCRLTTESISVGAWGQALQVSDTL